MEKVKNEKDVVFIVEDNKLQQEALQLHFEEVLGNYVVRIFPTPVDLIEHLDEGPFAVVLDHFFDPEAPTGLHYLKELRKTHPDTSIIYHTTLQDDGIRAEVMALGAVDYILKDSTSMMRLRKALDTIHKKNFIAPKRGFWKRIWEDYFVQG